LPQESDGRTAYFFEASKTVIAALASSDPATRRHAEAFREIGERCFKKWAPDFGK